VIKTQSPASFSGATPATPLGFTPSPPDARDGGGPLDGAKQDRLRQLGEQESKERGTASRRMTRRDVETAKFERDLAIWLTKAVHEMVVQSHGPVVDIPKWLQDQIVRGVRVRVTIATL
jgi:hypothetical protein